MKTKIVEATNNQQNWGKFLIGIPDVEWDRRVVVTGDPGQGRDRLLARTGWTTRHMWVLDLQTGEGAFFSPGGSATADLQKHRIWVCPLFEPFLEWLYQQYVPHTPMWVDNLPDMVNLPNAPFSMVGHRRPGPNPNPSLDSEGDGA